jgi:hypothetical protein
VVHVELLSAELLVKEPVIFSSANGEILRVELPTKEASEVCKELSFREETVRTGDGRRDCTLIAGEGDRVVDRDGLTGLAARDRRVAPSTLSSLLMAAIGS